MKIVVNIIGQVAKVMGKLCKIGQLWTANVKVKLLVEIVVKLSFVIMIAVTMGLAKKMGNVFVIVAFLDKIAVLLSSSFQGLLSRSKID